jgi:hypothetical protein
MSTLHGDAIHDVSMLVYIPDPEREQLADAESRLDPEEKQRPIPRGIASSKAGLH